MSLLHRQQSRVVVNFQSALADPSDGDEEFRISRRDLKFQQRLKSIREEGRESLVIGIPRGVTSTAAPSTSAPAAPLHLANEPPGDQIPPPGDDDDDLFIARRDTEEEEEDVGRAFDDNEDEDEEEEEDRDDESNDIDMEQEEGHDEEDDHDAQFHALYGSDSDPFDM